MEAKRASAGVTGVRDRAETGGGGGGITTRASPTSRFGSGFGSFGSFGSFGFASFGFGSFAAACSREDSAARAWSSRRRANSSSHRSRCRSRSSAQCLREDSAPRYARRRAKNASASTRASTPRRSASWSSSSTNSRSRVDPEVQDTSRCSSHCSVSSCTAVRFLCAFERRCVRASMGPIRPLSSASSASVRCTMDEMRSVARSVWARMRRKLVARASIVAGPRVRGRARVVVVAEVTARSSTPIFQGRDRRSAALVSGIQNYSEASRVSGPAAPPGRGDGARLIPRASSRAFACRARWPLRRRPSRRTVPSRAAPPPEEPRRPSPSSPPLARASFRVVTPVAIRAGSTTRSSDDARANETFARSSVRVASPASECARLPPRTPSRDSQLG